jgi:hypothetical protein
MGRLWSEATLSGNSFSKETSMAIAPSSTPLPKDIQDAVDAQKSYLGLEAEKRLETHKG